MAWTSADPGGLGLKKESTAGAGAVSGTSGEGTGGDRGRRSSNIVCTF